MEAAASRRVKLSTTVDDLRAETSAKGDLLFHYTSRKAAEQIAASGFLVDKDGVSFTTRTPVDFGWPDEAGPPTEFLRGKGRVRV